MTEKRFTYDNGNLFDNKMNTFYPIEDSEENIEILCDRLNWLVDETEQLKKHIEYLQRKIQRERKSNIRQNEKWEKEATDLIREQRKFIDDLSKENEQLKQQLESFKPIIFESDGKPVTLYQKGDME